MPDLDFIRSEIERMRVQVGRQRKEMLQLSAGGYCDRFGTGIVAANAR